MKEKEAEEQKKKGLIPPEGKKLDPFKRVPDNRPRLPRNPLVPRRRVKKPARPGGRLSARLRTR